MFINCKSSSFITNVINFSSEKLDNLPNVNPFDVNEASSISLEVDLLFFIEPDLEWLTTQQDIIRSKNALTLVLTKSDNTHSEKNYQTLIDNVVTIKNDSYSRVIKDIIESLTSDNMIGVDFGDFITTMTQGSKATLYSGDYTKNTEFDFDYLTASFPDSIDYKNSKALFVIISFSFDFISGIEDFADVVTFFRGNMPENSVVAVTAQFTTDNNGARVSAILVE